MQQVILETCVKNDIAWFIETKNALDDAFNELSDYEAKMLFQMLIMLYFINWFEKKQQDLNQMK